MNPMYQAMYAQDPLTIQQQQRGMGTPPVDQQGANGQKMGIFGGGMTSDQAAGMIKMAAMMMM